MLHHSMQDYMAHGYCFAWEPPLVWLHVISDIVTGLAYYSIPLALFYFAYKRRDLPFLSMFVLFGVFILSCGTTHLFAALTVFTPWYWEEGFVKAFTAVVSGVSAILFIPLLPKAIAMPSLTRAVNEIKQLNITLEKQVDELILFKNLINQANDAIFVIDPATGRFLDVNAKACSNLGYDREELLKMLVLDIDDPVILDTFAWKALFSKIKNEVVLEVRHRRKNGTTYPVEVNVKYISLEKGDYIVAVARDITERKQAEKDLQSALAKAHDEKTRSEAIITSMGEGLSIQDTDFMILYQNKVQTDLIGDHVGEPCYKAYENKDDICEGCPVAMSYKDGSIHKTERAVAVGKETIHVEITASPLRDMEGNIVAGIEVIRDVTDQKKLEAQLRHSQKMEAVGTLAGGIAHDFNNILNVIIGYGTMVMDRTGDDLLSKDYMNEVLNASERAVNLTNKLLVFSRKQAVDVKPININETILGLQKMLFRVIRENIEFNLDLADSPLIVMADPGQIEQVLMNLAANARDAMPEGGRLTIGTELHELDDGAVAAYGYGKPGRYALITIADTGCGIDAETQKKIFEPFFTTKGIGEGTGLGLAISYGIIKQHCGYIMVYSELLKGSEFKIYLPLVEESSTREEGISRSVSVIGGNETILVAEDDASLRQLARLILESHGYSVITAEDGEDAIAKFTENRERISLALIDMIMPKKNGKEVATTIRKVSPRIKILFVSGYTMDVVKTRELTDAGFDLLRKPILPIDLLLKVREVLDR